MHHKISQGPKMLNFKPFREGNWKCVHRQDLPWNQSQYPCIFQIYWNYHFCLSVHCQNSPKLHLTSEEHLWPCKNWNYANHFRFKFNMFWNLISIYQVTTSALLFRLENVPANFFWAKCVRLSSCRDWDFRNHTTIFRRLLNVAENVQRCSDNLKHLRSFWKAQF